MIHLVKTKSGQFAKRINNQIKNDRPKILFIFIGIIVATIAIYLIWNNFSNQEARTKRENKENKSLIANIAEGIQDAFVNMFNPPDSNLIAEFRANGNRLGDGGQESLPFVSVNKTSVYPGETLIQSGLGFTSGANVSLLFSSPSGRPASLSIQADQNGQFNHAHIISVSAETGVHYYWAEDITTGIVTDKVKFLVVPISEKKPLPEEIKEKDDQEKEKRKKEDANQQLSLPQECSFTGSGLANTAKRIVLNEVAWMGSTENHSNEWIELKNVSSSAINIAGWWLIDQAEQIKVVFPSNTNIPAGRFYLLERSDDKSAPNVRADMIYNGILSNSKEGIRLFNPDCLIEDEVLANPDWSEGNSAERKTMERKADLSGWHTSFFVNGTPKQENSAGIIIRTGAAVQEDEKRSEPTHSGRSGDGNPISYCSQINLSAPSGKILINEVAWAGDIRSPSNEWIELYNPGRTAISLNGWQILDKAERIKIVFTNADTIPAGGFYLLERTDDESVLGIKANKIYTGELNNSDETLRLFDGNCTLIDEIKDTGASWKNIGGSSDPDYRTAERLPDGLWHSFSGPTGTIMGTPKAANSPRVLGLIRAEERENNTNSGTATINALAATADNNNENGSARGSPANRVVISEIMPGLPGRSNDEFIELYNPTENTIALDGWHLARKATITSNPVNLVSKRSGLFNGKAIPPKSFLLIASQSYSGARTPDVVYSQKSNHLANNGDIIVFYTRQDEPILVMEYGRVETGRSLERKAFIDGACFQSVGKHEFLGNGCNINDTSAWSVRDIPNPQNLASLPEPRNAPVWPFAPSAVSISYDLDKTAIDIEWPSFTGIVRVSDGDKILWTGLGIGGRTSVKIYEFRKEQKINFEILDKDGLTTDEIMNFSVNIPSLPLPSEGGRDSIGQEAEVESGNIF